MTLTLILTYFFRQPTFSIC